MEHSLMTLGCWGPTPLDLGAWFCVMGITSHLSVRTVRLSFAIALAAFFINAVDWIGTTVDTFYMAWSMDSGWLITLFIVLPGVSMLLCAAALRSGLMLPKFTEGIPRLLGWFAIALNSMFVLIGWPA